MWVERRQVLVQAGAGASAGSAVVTILKCVKCGTLMSAAGDRVDDLVTTHQVPVCNRGSSHIAQHASRKQES